MDIVFLRDDPTPKSVFNAARCLAISFSSRSISVRWRRTLEAISGDMALASDIITMEHEVIGCQGIVDQLSDRSVGENG